jgi:hypothetical protein
MLFLTLLIGYRARGFAGRLAGSLAFAASAFHCGFLEILFVNGFNMFHGFSSGFCDNIKLI